MNIRIYIAFLFVIMLAACQKEGTLQPALKYYQVGVKWYYTPHGDMPFKVEVDGQVLTDSLIMNNSEYNYVQRLVQDNGQKLRHLVISDAEKDSIVLDTMIHVNGRRTVQLLAISPTDRPAIMGDENSGGTEPDPAEGAAKFRYYYSEPLLPDSVKMIFYYCRSRRPFVLDEPSEHSLIVRKGRFSDYLELDMLKHGELTAMLFDLRDARNDTLIQQVELARVLGISKGYSQAFNDNLLGDVITNKFVTAILRYGGPDEPTAHRERFHDFFLFGTPW